MQDACGTSPLMLSCFTGNVRITKVLLAYDADVNLQNNEGITALMMSCYSGHPEIVELLIRYGAEMDVVTTIGKSAHDFSTEKGHEDVSKLLVEHGCRTKRRALSRPDANSEQSGYNTPAYQQPQLKETLKTMEYLITSSSSQLENRMDRIEQILQTLIQNQASALTPPAARSAQQLHSEPTLREAFKLLRSLAHDWHNIGVMLNLESHLLKEIEQKIDELVKIKEKLIQLL